MRIGQIVYGKVHTIIDADIIPDYPPTLDGSKIICVDITDMPEVQEGWDYVDGKFTEPVDVEPEEILPEPTADELIGQQLVDMEIQSLLDTMQAQEERSVLGQQITDVEIAIMLGGM